MTYEEYMKLSKKTLADMLVKRDNDNTYPKLEIIPENGAFRAIYEGEIYYYSASGSTRAEALQRLKELLKSEGIKI